MSDFQFDHLYKYHKYIIEYYNVDERMENGQTADLYQSSLLQDQMAKGLKPHGPLPQKQINHILQCLTRED